MQKNQQYHKIIQGSYTFLLSKIKDFSGQKLVFKHLFLSIFIYKTLFNLIFLQVKMPVPSPENNAQNCFNSPFQILSHMAEIKI